VARLAYHIYQREHQPKSKVKELVDKFSQSEEQDAPKGERKRPSEHKRGESSGFRLSSDTAKLFAKYNGVTDEQEICRRVETARSEAMKHFPYRCIREYRFAYPRIMMHPYYNKLLWELNNKRILDIGCCTGTDIRQLVIDGAKTENLLGVDIEDGYFSVGFNLFGDKDKMQHRFAMVDVLSTDVENQNMALSQFLYPRPSAKSGVSETLGPQALDAVHCGSVFHLLNKEQCYVLSRAAFRFLSTSAAYCGVSSSPYAISSPTSKSGSSSRVAGRGVFFGRTVGSASEESFDRSGPGVNTPQLRYMHSTDSFKKMLTDVGFVNVECLVGSRDLPFDTAVEGDPTKMAMLYFVGFLP